jgi:hypothetical protein
MNRIVVALASLTCLACTNPPPVTATDGGVDGSTAPDAFAGNDASTEDLCPGGCTAPQLCCPVALSHACVDPTTDGVCPLPDLTVSQQRAEDSARVVWQFFEADDCAITEGCVESAGWRRLLRFDTYTPNQGTGDFRMGPPGDHPELFEYSSCHMHYHFNGYANYTLVDSTGATAATGHKQAFCLEDFEQYSFEPGVPTRAVYDCNDQGISAGWGDLYGAYLDCQWIDVTDVAPGDYTIHISINEDSTIPEISYDNNTCDAHVTILADGDVDPTAACPTELTSDRDCGWETAGTFTCTAGASVSVGCGGSCGVGSCTGDSQMRICEGTEPCGSHERLAQGDTECGVTGSYDCPGATFTCPTSGQYTVLVEPFAEGDTRSTCVPAAGAHF